jgi:hypothetical protein
MILSQCRKLSELVKTTQGDLGDPPGVPTVLESAVVDLA